MIVAADTADAAGNEVRVPRILSPHKHAVSTKYRGRAVALDHFAIIEIDFGEDSKTSDNSSYRVPVHFNEFSGFRLLMLVELRAAQRDRSFCTKIQAYISSRMNWVTLLG